MHSSKDNYKRNSNTNLLFTANLKDKDQNTSDQISESSNLLNINNSNVSKLNLVNMKENNGEKDFDDKSVIEIRKQNVISTEHLIDDLINKIGYTKSQYYLIIAIWMLYIAEGAQGYVLTMLMPGFKDMYSLNTIMFNLLATSLFFGFIIGTVLSGPLSASTSRKYTVLSATLLFTFVAFLSIIYENVIWLTINRMFIGISMGLIGPQLLSNFSEILPSSGKEILVLSISICYRLGIIYFIFCFNYIMPTFDMKYWRHAYLAAFIPLVIANILIILNYRDSPKLLLNRGRIDETITYFKETNYSNINYDYELEEIKSNYLKEQTINNLNNINSTNNNKNKNHFSSLFTQFGVLIFLCSLLFVTSSMVNICNMYSLPLMLYREHENKSYELMLTQIVTVPAIILSAFTCNAIGRKSTMLLGFFFSLIASLIPSIMNAGLVPGMTIINFFIIFSICGAKIFALEAFPTRLRDFALAFCLGVAKLGDSFTPILCNFSMKINSFGPLFIVNVLSAFGLLSSYMLPFDTLGKLADL